MIQTTELGDSLPEAKEEESSIRWRRRTIITYYSYSVFSLVHILNVFYCVRFHVKCEGLVSSAMRRHIILSDKKTLFVSHVYVSREKNPVLVDLPYVCRRLPE